MVFKNPSVVRTASSLNVYLCTVMMASSAFNAPLTAALLFEEDFDDGKAPTWKYYDHSLDYRDAPITAVAHALR